MKSFIIIAVFLLNASICSSQKSLTDIDLYRIPQKKIRNFIEVQKQKNVLRFIDIRPSCSKGEDLSELNEVTYSYILKDSLHHVWDKYHYTSPAESWNGNMISFGLLISKQINHVLYSDGTNFSGIDTGQVFYVNLGLLGGIYNLAVGLEIVDVNHEKKYFQFSYLKEGKSKGLQTIQLIELDGGSTQVVHRTLFKSDSPFRDKILYPFFHKRAITEFHRNMEYILTRDKQKTEKG